MALIAVGRAGARLGRRTEAAASFREAIAAWEAIPERRKTRIPSLPWPPAIPCCRA